MLDDEELVRGRRKREAWLAIYPSAPRQRPLREVNKRKRTSGTYGTVRAVRYVRRLSMLKKLFAMMVVVASMAGCRAHASVGSHHANAGVAVRH